MKKFLKVMGIFVALIAMVLVFGSCISSCVRKGTIKELRNSLNDSNVAKEEAEERVSELETELNNEKMRANKAEQQNVTAGDSSSYLDIKFPNDGNYYVDSYQSKFYRDANCTQLIENPRFLSWKQDEDLESPSGFPIKAMRLDSRLLKK